MVLKGFKCIPLILLTSLSRVNYVKYTVFAERHNPASPTVIKMWYLRQFIYFQKKHYLIIMRGASTGIQDSFFWADGGGIAAVQSYGDRFWRCRLSANTLYKRVHKDIICTDQAGIKELSTFAFGRYQVQISVGYAD
jgi:hypothetical protein